MNPTRHDPKSPPAASGRLVVLCALALLLALCVPDLALAAFTRSFAHPIPGTAGGVAVDEHDDLWVNEGSLLREFSPAYEAGTPNRLLATVAVESEAPRERARLAVERSSGHFYVVNGENGGRHGEVEVFEESGKRRFAGWENKHVFDAGGGQGVRIAVDTSSSPLDKSACSVTGCTVYVSHAGQDPPSPAGDGLPPGIERLNASGEVADFEGCATCSSYVKAGEITGTPAGAFGPSERPGAITVDSLGDLYVAVPGGVDEFRPSGEFVQEFTGSQTPGLGESGAGQFGGFLEGVAIDPLNQHLLVSVSNNAAPYLGAVDEFDSATGQFLDQIAEAAEGSKLSSAAELTVDSHGDLYAVDQRADVVDAYEPGRFLPTVALGTAGGRTGTSAVLSGSVDPNGFRLTECDFEYVSEAAFNAPIRNEVQSVTLAGATGGSFALTFEGQRTAAIAYDAPAAGAGSLQSALEALSTIGAGDVVVTGAAGGPYKVEFVGSLAHLKLPQLEVDFSALVGATAVSAITLEGSNGGFGTAAKASCAPVAASIPTGETTAVTGEATGLTAGTTYRYRLLAHSEGAEGGSSASRVLAFTAPGAPAILATSVAKVSATFVELDARIAPRGAATTYYFQYGPTTAYGHDVPALTALAPHGVSIGSGGPTGGAVESVAQATGGLTPGTTYHYRAIAESEVEGRQVVAEGPDQTFTTLAQAVAGLPDGRAYELVTPADKQGGGDMFAEPQTIGEYQNRHSLLTPAESGDDILLETYSNFGAFPTASYGAYVFRRVKSPRTGEPEWTYNSLADPALGVQTINANIALAPADLSRVAFADGVGAIVGPEGERVTSLQGPPGGPYTTLFTDPPLFGEASSQQRAASTLVGGASRDLSHVVLETGNNRACPGAEKVTAGDLLCESAGGELTLVNLNAAGEVASRCGAALGLGGSNEQSPSYHAVSADGSRVIFTAPDPQAENRGPACWNGGAAHAPQLYLREALEGPLGEVTHRTIELSAPESGVSPPVDAPAAYVGASEDGSRIFFATKMDLTHEALELGLHDSELYEWRAEGAAGPAGPCASADGCLTRISAGAPGSPDGATGAGVSAVPAISGDGGVLYFLAFGALAEGATPGLEDEPGGPVNLYRYEASTGATKYVTTVDRFDYPKCGEQLGVGGVCSLADWYTTADGRYLLFQSSLPIGGYNEATGCPVHLPNTEGQGADGRCAELYRYDSLGGGLVCVSCNPSGVPPAGNAQFTRSAPGSVASAPVRAMSENGAYVFFDTPDRLVSTAENHTLDVYEWHEGRISLIGSPNDPFPTYFLGYSPNPAAHTEAAREAGNVFIGTHARLLTQQTNTVGNIYDARACEPESPCIQPEQGETAQCLGGECQKPPPAPAEPIVKSFGWSYGAGNLTSEPPPPPKRETAAQIRAKHLAAALKLCRKKPNKHKRATCERAARAKYAVKASSKRRK